jgi:hypothetical protein
MTLVSVLIGSIATLFGGWLQARLSQKAQRRQRIIDLKINVLQQFMGYRVGLIGDKHSQSVYKPIFIPIANSIDVAFSDNKKVVAKYFEYKEYIELDDEEKIEGVSLKLLHEVAIEMYKDLGISPPDFNYFQSVLN